MSRITASSCTFQYAISVSETDWSYRESIIESPHDYIVLSIQPARMSESSSIWESGPNLCVSALSAGKGYCVEEA